LPRQPLARHLGRFDFSRGQLTLPVVAPLTPLSTAGCRFSRYGSAEAYNTKTMSFFPLIRMCTDISISDQVLGLPRARGWMSVYTTTARPRRPPPHLQHGQGQGQAVAPAGGLCVLVLHMPLLLRAGRSRAEAAPPPQRGRMLHFSTESLMTLECLVIVVLDPG
jgi:hypothetical protein